jgi:hypothetical protein
VNLAYCDDSKDGGDLAVMGSVVLSEDAFHMVEKYLSVVRDHLVPEVCRRDPFEFKASALFNGQPPFEGIGRDVALDIFRAATVVVGNITLTPIFYGAVNIRDLKKGPFATAEPLDVAFRGCLEGFQKWVAEKSDTGEMLMVVCDDSSHQNLKKQLRQSYRRYRGSVGSEYFADYGLAGLIHDDLYFGDSKYSVGLQLADICSYIVLRHLQGKEDTEFLYSLIKKSIYHAVYEPGDVVSPQEKFQAFQRPKPDEGQP